MNALRGAASSVYTTVSSLLQGCVYPPEREEEQALDAALLPAPAPAAPAVAQEPEPVALAHLAPPAAAPAVAQEPDPAAALAHLAPPAAAPAVAQEPEPVALGQEPAPHEVNLGVNAAAAMAAPLGEPPDGYDGPGWNPRENAAQLPSLQSPVRRRRKPAAASPPPAQPYS